MSPQTIARIRLDSLANFVCNVIINGWLTWFLVQSKSALPVWQGEGAIAWDITFTVFLLVLIIALIVIPLTRAQARKTKSIQIQRNSPNPIARLVRTFPQNFVLTALLFGGLALVIVTPLILAWFVIFNIEKIAAGTYAIGKGLGAGIVAALVVWPLEVYSLLEPSQPS